MANSAPPPVPMDSTSLSGAALQHGHWRNRRLLASGLARLEHFLEHAGFDRAPWLVVAFAAGIAAWFTLDNPGQWIFFLTGAGGLAGLSLVLLREQGRFPYLRQACAALSLAALLGCGLVWTKSALVGVRSIDRPLVAMINGKVLERVDQPADHRVRLLLATREPVSGRAIRARVNLDVDDDLIGLVEGAEVRLRVRLMPPAAPMLPGGYDFARVAWFGGIAATGSVLGKVTLVRPGEDGGSLGQAQRALSRHVRANLDGSPGTLAAAFASGDRGAIAPADEEAMRNAGLTHLLSISGLHVSAVIAAVYALAGRLFALWPWLALRVRVPLLAAATGALAGIGYTLLTGAEVPTVRSCIGAMLVLLALVLGREALSMRMVATGAFLVLVFWPEALVGPSFQMSFAAVIAIIAVHGSGPVRAFLAPREEGWLVRQGRNLAMLLLTGVVIELALMPIGLFHFHQAGVYGALANVIAIPLTTVASMPLIALALLFDLAGIGAPFWWLAGKSLELLLALAHWTAAMPGAVTTMPAMGQGAFLLFVSGGLWLALWSGRVRLLGLAPALIGAASLASLRAPDLLISGDGRHVGIGGEGQELLVLRPARAGFALESLTELAGMSGGVRVLDEWPGAQCNHDFCAIRLRRGERDWQLLLSRGSDLIPERDLAAACERADLVISDRFLPRSCRPRWLKADRRYLERSGGLAIDLEHGKLTSVAQGQGEHGWWKRPEPRPFKQRSLGSRNNAASATEAADAAIVNAPDRRKPDQ
ncbi:ComEC/Rec2 family competence protein [Novosphingobium sp. B 225]|uniref:ComEC/Rec2 family competence protein n=1 Tax=Novosphingobium sp. B 225 TaxID=1961849 RepID=UPI000B4B3547|nr:ComEC/Rec2 family competence protein [Novosphingobium sp. B 225]